MGAAKRFEQNPGNSAICYYRYSSDAQRDVSIEQQREQAHEYAKRNGMRIIKEYSDSAISGTKDDRPGFQLMLHEVEMSRPAYLILWKTDRLSRDRYDAPIAKKRLRDCGVKIVYVAESLPENEAEQILLESIYEGMAASFIYSHRQNVLRGLKYNAENCLYNGRKTLGHKGQVNMRYEIDTDTAPIVVKIYKDYADGVGMQEIVDELNGAGYRSVYGRPFSINSIRHILRNRSYLGEYKYDDVLIPDGMPRIITDELFQRVQERLAYNRRGGRTTAMPPAQEKTENPDFWLTGHIVCAHCGGTVCGTCGTGKHGERHYYYMCINRKKKKSAACRKKNVRKDVVESIVMDILIETVNSPAMRILTGQQVYEHYSRLHSSDDSYRRSLENKIKETEKTLGNIMKAIEAGIFNETTQSRMLELQKQKGLLEDELAAERLREQYSLKPEHVVKYLESFTGNLKDPEVRRRVLELLINKIILSDDSVAITFNFSDDRREFDLAEMTALIENREKILKILDSHESLIYNGGYKDTVVGDSDFFVQGVRKLRV